MSSVSELKQRLKGSELIRFQHNKVENLKAIKQVILGKFGKINVICGKNSSGKSTLLESFLDTSKTIIGKTLDEEEIKQLEESYSGVAFEPQYQGTFPSPDAFKNCFQVALEETLKVKPFYFADETELFLEELSNTFKEKLNSNVRHIYRLDIRQLRVSFENLLKLVFPQTILLPPKRNLEANEEIRFENEVNPNGIGLLNKLFYAKNQPINSQEYKTYKQIQEKFLEISSDYGFDVFSDTSKIDRINTRNLIKLKFSRSNKTNWIDASDCGLGLRDLLVILYFALSPDYRVILIEEPENHVHPEMQRKILRFLSEETEKQYFISTHSNIFLNTTYTDKIFFTTFEEGEIKVSDATKRTEILNELGSSVSENLVSDLIILVEGPKDTPIIEEYLKKFGIDAEYNIKTWALGGDIMDQVDLTVFAERYKVIALIDKDPSSGKIRKRFIEKCKELEIPVTRLKRYAIENYFSVRALREVFGGQIPKSFTEIDNDETLENQIKINVKNNNRKLAQAMELEEIEGTDFYRFFEKVREMCES